MQEITSEYDTELANEEGQKLHRAWKLDVLNDILVLERYGSPCGWAELRLKKKGLEVYRIMKPWGSEERTEHFFNQPKRVYTGDQFSFVEYIAQIAGQGRFPTAEEYVRAGLDTDVEKQYRDNLQKILDTETK
ncbi:hypothetical protein HYZ41_02810 [archaeon]|nr:hypothetical protein [archaeon]